MSRALQAFISVLEQDRALREPSRLRERSDVLERLETWRFCGQPPDAPAVEAGLRDRVEALCAEFEAIDGRLYQGIRQDILHGAGAHRLLECMDAGTFP